MKKYIALEKVELLKKLVMKQNKSRYIWNNIKNNRKGFKKANNSTASIKEYLYDL